MLLNAVIVKNNVKRIKEIARTKTVYATDVDNDNASCEMRFYKNLDAAKSGYPKAINGKLEIIIDTDNMQFYAANNEPVFAKPKFSETDAEYIFTFDERIKDLHCVCIVEGDMSIMNTKVSYVGQKRRLQDNEITEKMHELANMIGYEPKDICYLKKAMYSQKIQKLNAGKNNDNYTNSRYATLGDVVLKLVLTELYFDKGCDKQDITENKKRLESNKALFDICKKKGIYRYAYNDNCFFDNAPLENQLPHPKHDFYIEAIIAAIYKDRGLEYCRTWIMANICEQQE